jgi:hypothetical protein
MMIKKIFFAAFVVFCFSALPVFAQQTTTSNIVKQELSQAEIDRIVKKFSENETNFRTALTNYVFNRDVLVETLGMGGQISGAFKSKSFMALTPSGERIEHVLFAPISTLPLGFMTAQDFEDLGGVTPFALEPSAISQYNFTYLGKEKIDDLNLHVFEVTPKIIPDPKKSKLRLFIGRIWVDDRDLMIVKTKGKGVPETKTNKFPIVETWRENIDGKYWFPSFASSDDELLFDKGYTVKLRMRVKYDNYRLGRTDVKILDDDEEIKEDAKPTPTPKP